MLQTKRVNVKNEFMTYTKQFKYLGSYISNSLQDIISNPALRSHQSSMLKPTAIPMNLLLLKKSLLDNLKVREMSQTNKQVRKRLPCVEKMIVAQLLSQHNYYSLGKKIFLNNLQIKTPMPWWLSGD
jgi:hypothetical protein